MALGLAWRLFCVLVAFNAQFQSVHSIYLAWKKNAPHDEEAFHIPFTSLFKEGGNATSGPLARYKATYRNKTLDERCELGLPLSIGWHWYSPYANTHQSVYRGQKGFTVNGMFPHVLKSALKACCHPNATVTHGKLMQFVRQAERDVERDLFDFIFPLYGKEGQTEFRKHAFINLVVAPRVILLVRDDQSSSQTQVLFQTIMRAWPMLLFILVTASLSGVIIWFLDHSLNPDEFPPPFLRGSWEGFWWALVTMTTVGYGDRSPKSALGRVFCILWILTGIVIVSIFTALVTASLSASTVQHFIVHGSKIGAVNGSQEYQLGVTMNAQMEVSTHIYDVTKKLLAREIDGALVDNYVVTYHVNLIQDDPIRVERYIDHKIPYGMALASGSQRLEKCIRSHLADYPQEVFERIAENLKPLRNPTDYENQMLKAAEGLFYEEALFNWIMYIGLGLVAACFLAGFVWEFACRRPRMRKQRTLNVKDTCRFTANDETVKLHPADKSEEGQLDDMITEYQLFHDAWIDKLKKIRDKNYNQHRNNCTDTTV